MKQTSQHCKYTIGQAVGQVLADRIIQLTRQGATIIDNCAHVVQTLPQCGTLEPSTVFEGLEQSDAQLPPE